MHEARFKAYSEGSQDLVHSDAFVVMFLGYLQSKRLIAPGVMGSVLIDTWIAFKAEMGKNPDGSMQVKGS